MCNNTLLPRYVDALEKEDADEADDAITACSQEDDATPYVHGDARNPPISYADAQANARAFNNRLIRRTPVTASLPDIMEAAG